jgi:Tol biopolymer transport system component
MDKKKGQTTMKRLVYIAVEGSIKWLTMGLWPLVSLCLVLGCEKIEVVNPPPADTVFSVFYPFWSHDGSKILFIGHLFGRESYDFYEVSPTGGVASLIMRDDSLAKSWPVLSPDGTKIAYLAAEIGRLLCCAHVWVINVDGTNARDLTPFFSNWEYLRWSPDSRYVVFDGGVEDSGAINYQIVKADVQTGELRMLTRGQYGNRDASFLPDGHRISYVSGRIRTDYGGKVWVMNADGSDPRPIDTTRTASTSPRPSPIGNELYFYWGLGLEGDAGIYAVKLDSVDLPAPYSSFRLVHRENYLHRGQWSPDGNWLLSLRGYSSTTADLVLLDRHGNFDRRITNGFNVYLFNYAWSPDSHRLVFVASDDFNNTTSLFVFDLRTNSRLKLAIQRN